MSTIMRTTAWIALAASLGACVSTPATRYYTLSPAASVIRPAAPLAIKLDVQPVIVPVAVDRQELVIRQSTDTLALLENDRWASPLGDEIRTALAASLSHRLGAQDVSGLPSPPDAQVLRVRVAVRSFESQPGKQAMIEADWVLDWSGKPSIPALSCSSLLSAPVGREAQSWVKSHQQLLETLALQIETAARQRSAGTGGSCPAS